MAPTLKKRLGALMLALCLAAALAACGGTADRPAVESTERQFTAPAEGDLIAIFSTSLGEVRAVLYPDAAPMAVYNFVGLARSGYYDGTVIWRVEQGFAVQGPPSTPTIPSRWRRTAACATTPALCAPPPPRATPTAGRASFTLSPPCRTAWTRPCRPS